MCALTGLAMWLGAAWMAAVAQPAHALELRIGNVQVDESPVGRGSHKFAALVQEKSGGRIKVTVLNGGKAGSDTEMREKLVKGELEIMAASATLFASAAKEVALWDTPFLFASYAEADAILDGMPGRKVLETLAPKGMIGLAYWENGFRNLTNSLRPVTKLEDLQNLRLRVQQSEVFINMFKAFGTQVQPMPFPQVYGALQNKAIDAQENPLPVIVSAKLHEVQGYLTLTRHSYSPFLVAASRQWWDTLKPEDQKIIRDAAYETRVSQRQDARRVADAALAELQAKGMKVSELQVGERARIERKLEQVNTSIATKVGLPLFIETVSELQKLRQTKK
ncbi:MAG: DctP family TRAP transporter solute-binding subunit [Comamonadaceae bacterium]|nr:DctP family TRAP transporter solute-binding subunit [Comamonadaceae bacterium]